MKTTRSLFIGISLLLSSCNVMLPQNSGLESEGEAIPPGSGGVVVEKTVEEVIIGQESGEPGPVTVEIIGGDEAALREFMSRYVTYPGGEADHIRIYLGSLPPEMTYELPLSESSRVIGSVQQSQHDVLQIILEAALSPDEIRAFYTQSLPEAGWQLASDARYGGGFISSDFGETYCQGEELFLSVNAGTLPDGKTDVRIYIQSSQGYSPCAPDQAYGDPVSELIPVLKNPQGTRSTSMGGGGGSSDRDAYNETHLEGDLSAAEAAAHYNDQLTAAGWTLVERGGAEGVDWSTWTFTDADGDSWTGTLFVSDVPPGSGRLFAYVSVERLP